jgi:hypothetical protein
MQGTPHEMTTLPEANEPEESGGGTNLPASSPEVDFSLVLSRVIGAVKDDPAQLRDAVYELARFKLQREAWLRDPPMERAEMRRVMQALEGAIARVETISAKHDELAALQSLDRLIESSGIGRANMVMAHPELAQREPLMLVDQAADAKTARAPAGRTPLARPGSWRDTGQLARGVAVVLLAVALCVVLDRQFGLFGRHDAAPATAQAPAAPTSASAPVPAPAAAAPTLPLPGVYGIYALGAGKLYELEAIPGRVPDQKVFMSTAIKTPSRTVLPDGQVAFIVYRRDLAANAPDRVSVRVIARVMRAMSFSTAGQANTASLEDQWTIRSNAYELRVAPVSEHPEMLMLRPEVPDFALPAGRYGLVLKGQAYDFSIAGAVTDPAQCLERIEAANGAFYSECRNP